MQVIEYYKIKVFKIESILAKIEYKITKRKAKRFILIKYNNNIYELIYRESLEKLSRYIY